MNVELGIPVVLAPFGRRAHREAITGLASAFEEKR
jgi:hypothetical protein